MSSLSDVLAIRRELKFLPESAGVDASKDPTMLFSGIVWGQFIFVIPKYDMIVVFTNNNSASYYEEIKPIALLYDYILPAIED